MKTSNILITVFIGCITLYILAAFAEVRISGKRNSLGLDFENHTIAVKHFRYIAAKDIHFDLGFGEHAEININSEKGKTVSKVNYHLKGDTLVIDGFEKADGVHSSLKITVPQNFFRELECVKCDVSIKSGDTDSLILKLDQSQVSKWDNQESHFRMLRIFGSDNTHVTLRSIKADNLDMSLDNCQVNVHGPVNLLTGSMINNTHLEVDNVLNFSFQRDSTSTLNHRR